MKFLRICAISVSPITILAWTSPSSFLLRTNHCRSKLVSCFNQVFSDDETRLIQSWLETENDLQAVLREQLPTLSPQLIVKLNQSQNHENRDIAQVAIELNSILTEQLNRATETLRELLNAGEIRKLDALIGKAAREERLDVAFFNVLQINLRDAAVEESLSSDDKDTSNGASRLQILRHVYTRCQEEVEKQLEPGTALLNKLLRTEQSLIRANIYKHYLTEQPNVITSPDGKQVELPAQPPLISLQDFCSAIGQAVKQIRTVENAGGTDREMAAGMVESLRHIAKEARSVLMESYGDQSKPVQELQDLLQPIFRPTSVDSVYIKGT